MNRRAIGIFIAAIIAVMLIAATNLTPMIQQRQAYAASPTSSLKDNLRANLGNRNQHLNQQGNCTRTDECTTSDVGQGTLGNNNQVTGFGDQSDNIQQSAPATPESLLELLKTVICPKGVTCPDSFRIHVVGGIPPDFVLKSGERTIIFITDTPYQVTEEAPPTPPNLVLSKQFIAPACRGSISPGDFKHCDIVNVYNLKR